MLPRTCTCRSWLAMRAGLRTSWHRRFATAHGGSWRLQRVWFWTRCKVRGHSGYAAIHTLSPLQRTTRWIKSRIGRACSTSQVWFQTLRMEHSSCQYCGVFQGAPHGRLAANFAKGVVARFVVTIHQQVYAHHSSVVVQLKPLTTKSSHKQLATHLHIIAHCSDSIGCAIACAALHWTMSGCILDHH